ELGVQKDQPGQQREIRKAIERRIPEGAELRLQLEFVRDLSVDHVEDVRDDYDHAGPDEMAVTEGERGADVDQIPDDRQLVGVDSEGDAKANDRPKRIHAQGADGACEGHAFWDIGGVFEHWSENAP